MKASSNKCCKKDLFGSAQASYMRIMSPLASSNEVAKLAEAGADEFYCGVVPAKWEKLYTLTQSVNLRHDRAANMQSFAELRKAVQIADSYGKKIFLTLNAHFYSPKQIDAVIRYSEEAIKAGVHSLIVSDVALIGELRRQFPGTKISLSTAQPCFNKEAMNFFQSIGVSRIILPRHLRAGEAVQLVKHAKSKHIETEAFVLNAMCPFIDGLCTFQHVVERKGFMKPVPLACRDCYLVNVVSGQNECLKAIAANHAKIWQGRKIMDCGLCIIPALKSAGVTSAKIVGRAHPLEKKLADVKAVKQAIESAGRKDFREKAKLIYFEIFGSSCGFGHCYYPDAGGLE
jgi:collagenase-like PrtC family protease